MLLSVLGDVFTLRYLHTQSLNNALRNDVVTFDVQVTTISGVQKSSTTIYNLTVQLAGMWSL